MMRRSQHVFFMVCGALLLSTAFSAHAEELADYREQLTLFSLAKDGPVVDGILDDPCWNDAHAQKARGFVRLMDVGKIEPASADTEVMSCYDDENVYFAVKVHEPNMDKLKVSTSPVQPWRGDCIEVFVGPEGKGQSYFHFVVDTAEQIYNGLNEHGQEQAISFEWSVKCSKSESFWTVEMALPFASLGCEKPEDNQRWDFNFGRERYAQKEQVEMSSWATLGDFTQRHRFGKLAFYSRHEIAADITYWENSDRDPLLRRKDVSGIKLADRFLKKGTGKKRIPDLWTYYPFDADRGPKTASGSYPTPGCLNEETKATHPEFYKAAMDINMLLVQKSFLDEKLRSAKRARYYEGHIGTPDAQGDRLDGDIEAIQEESSTINADLNDLYQFYGRAFEANRSVEQLSGLDSKIEAIAGKIQRLDAGIGEFMFRAASGVVERTGPWKSKTFELPPEKRYLNDDGTSRRYQFSAFRSAHLESLWPLGPFEGFTINHPIPWPVSDTAGEFNFPKLRGYIDRKLRESSGRIKSFSCMEPSYRGGLYPMTQWMLEKAGNDPDLILQTEDGKQAPVVASRVTGEKSQLNPHNPAALEYIRGYLKSFAAEFSSQVKTDYFLTGWEGNAEHVGYNPSSQSAFRDYLKERYGSAATLNAKWKTEYASFEAIEIPYEQYTSPARDATGLTYEFERWGRLNYVRLLAKMRQFLKEGAPNVPVMSDPSYLHTEGNTYLMYKENACDIMSYHSKPGSEGAMWVYLNTMNRVFGKITGNFENYYGMWSRAHLNDERLSRRDLDKYFFEFFMRDVRSSAWWLRAMSHPTSYVVAYNTNSFGLDYSQTIYRWSQTTIPVMFRKCRLIEKALLESHQEVPGTAIIQPCATVFNEGSMNPRGRHRTDPIRLMFDLHNKLLSPASIAHDYLPEEMVIDGKGSLDDYTVLFLPYAPYMSEEFSRRLTKWVKKGGTLIAVGPFSLKNEFGLDLVSGNSMFKTLFPTYKKIGPGGWDYSEDGTDQKSQPAVTTKNFGKGQVVYLNRMIDEILRNPSLKPLLTDIVKDVCEQTATSPDSDLRILVREGNQGEKYLGLCNDNVEDSIETTVLVEGTYARPKDVLVSDWFPVPSRIIGDQTELKIQLEPGEWTMFTLE